MQRQHIQICPSLLSADPWEFGAGLQAMEACGIAAHHVDVMDGHFVPNLTFGLPLVRSLKKNSSVPLDVHIMITNPDEMAALYVEAGADILTFHVEAARHHHRLIHQIKELGAKAGVALNPGTPVESLYPLLPYIDQVTVMSVNPGFGGQSYIPAAATRVKQICDFGCEQSCDFTIQVDGGMNQTTALEVVQAGASSLVAGSYLYGHAEPKLAVTQLQSLAARLPGGGLVE